MDNNYKTSQTEWSLTEGKGGAGPGVQYGSEPTGVPGPVTQPVKGESIKMEAMQTSQQKASGHDKPEGN